MNTFLPYECFISSASCLDNKRLNKQIVECEQILSALTTGKGWIYHPAVKMWAGYENALCIYAYCCEQERLIRSDSIINYKPHKSIEKICKWFEETNHIRLGYFYPYYANHSISLPPWIGNEEFHERMKINLYFKDKSYYKKFFHYEYKPYIWYDYDINDFKLSKADIKRGYTLSAITSY